MTKPWFSRLLPKMSSTVQPLSIQERAQQGEADAQFAMGLKLSAGPENQRDLPLAAEWYRKAALQNHLQAQYNLGIMLSHAQGIPKDDAEAIGWMSRAAYSGHAAAQFNMGNRLSRADLRHSEPDAVEARIEAYKWFQLAASQGYLGSVANQERMTFQMSHGEVSRGNERVTSFVPTLAILA